MSANENADYRTCLAFASRFAAEPYSNFGLCYAPFPRFQTSCNSGSGGSQRQTQAGHCALCYAVTARPFANEQYACISEHSPCRSLDNADPALPSLRDPTLVSLRDPALPSLGKPSPVSSSAVTARPHFGVTAKPFANEQCFAPEQYGKGSWQSAFPDQLSKGTLLRKKSTCKLPRSFPGSKLRAACRGALNECCKPKVRPALRPLLCGHWRDPALQSLRDPLPLTRWRQFPIFGKGSWQSAC